VLARDKSLATGEERINPGLDPHRVEAGRMRLCHIIGGHPVVDGQEKAVTN